MSVIDGVENIDPVWKMHLTRSDASKGNTGVIDLRLRALGAAGLAAGFASSHFV